jgi:SAM-dependent methyltransferase
MDRQTREATFHDAERSLLSRPSNGAFYSVTRESYGYAMWQLRRANPTIDSKVLDYCCGNGGHTRDLFNYFYEVDGIDISPISIENARRAMKKPDFQNHIFWVMDAEHTTLPCNYYDAVTCNGVLHHLDLDAAYKELARILKPGGRVFCLEPLAYNPLFQLYRRLTPGLRTEWEAKHILTLESVKKAEQYGLEPVNIRYFHLFTLLAVPFRHSCAFGRVLDACERLDGLMLRTPLKYLAWQVYFELRKG